MKRQIGFAEAESLGKKRVTKRQRFLAKMEKVVPWQRLLTAIGPSGARPSRGYSIHSARKMNPSSLGDRERQERKYLSAPVLERSERFAFTSPSRCHAACHSVRPSFLRFEFRNR
jgi:hypothetical protein